ncbi:MAG: DNA repair protein RecN [Saprospiraceae bacterium]|nr:DNA repair protein RecN [Saprospiraceae bacterium]
MLSRLIIRNYAIIPELDIDIQPGLTIITGETGAGKSILLGALGLALGRRAETKVLPDDDSKCIVEAHFQLEEESLQPLFSREGLDYDSLLICRREISTGGRSRSFINDTPVSLKVLQEVTGHLIELHHQHDNLALQSKEYQINLLDTISGSNPQYKEYTELYNQLNIARSEMSRTKELELSSARKKEFLSFQLAELENAKLVPGEITSLEDNQNMLEHAEAIDHVLSHLQSVLSDSSQSLTAQVTGLIKQIESVRAVFPPISEIGDRIQAVRVEIQDLALEAGRLEGPGQNDPAKLAKVHARLNQLYNLIKKYQCRDDAELLEVQLSLRTEWSALSSVNDQIAALEEAIAGIIKNLQDKGEELTKKRKAGAKKILPKVIALLHELGMTNAQYTIEIHPITTPGVHGLDDIQFMFSANKGTSLQPLQAVASGGELSRLSLALKSIYAAQAQLPTIIFDEIDTGISGEVAWRMGQLIRSLAGGHQILMITHSPQIAAHATIQYHVSKITAQDKDISSIQFLTPPQRVIELAKMLSGDPPSIAALTNAESLINAVKN